MIWGHFDPCHPSPVCNGGVKNGSFWGQNQVTMAKSPRDPGITLKLFNASYHIYMKRKTWFRAWMTPAILLPCARGVKNGRFWGQNQVTMAGSPLLPGHEWRGQNMVDFRSQWQGHLAILESLWTLYTPQIKSINRNTCLKCAIVMLIPLVDK